MPNNEYENESNQSRSEDIIASILDGTEYDEPARSRIEYLLIKLKEAIEGGGGGGGVTSYSPLTEKPKIDNHTLQAGNNTSSDLGLQTKIDPENKLSADNVDDTNSTNKFNVKSDWNAASGATSEILNKPTLGTASAKNVPASGDAATGEVVLGSDTRLTDARNAKDVYNWAKQASKPTYSYSEIQNPPTIPDELSDLADDSTHRTVTDTEKDTWNGKQNALTFDDAPTSNSGNPVKSGGVYTALSGKQNNLSEAQMAAVNSGITSADVEQITTNENNILSVLDADGQKNVLNFNGSTPTVPTGVTMTDNGDGTYTLTKTVTTQEVPYIAAQLKAGMYILSGSPANGSDDTYSLDIRNASGQFVGGSDYGNGCSVTIPSDGWYRITCRLAASYTTTGIIIKPMLCDPALWAVSHKFEPYALSNAELTAKGQVNENNILLNARNGVGNYINSADVTISASGYVLNALDCNIPQGDYYLKYTSTQTISGNIQITLKDSNNTTVYDTTTTSTSGGNLIPITLSTEAKTITIYSVRAGTYSNLQIISKSLYDAGLTDYQPYALSNAELTADVASLTAKSQKTISSSGNTSKLRLTLNTSAMSNANRGSLLLSIPFQTSSYDNALLMIAIGNDRFLGVQRLDNSNNSMVTSWALSENNTILDITLRAQPWSAPVAFPLAQVVPPITYSWES